MKEAPMEFPVPPPVPVDTPVSMHLEVVALHRCWRTAKQGEWCDCPIPGDHNPSAWRSRGALDEIGCPCDRELAASGIHDSFACPLGIWIGPLGSRWV